MEPVLFYFNDLYRMTEYRFETVPEKPMLPVALAGLHASFASQEKMLRQNYLYWVFALCDEDNKNCGLYDVALDDTGVHKGIVPVPNGTIPLSISNDLAVVDGQVCVGGSGIACFDGSSWEIVVPADAGIFTAISDTLSVGLSGLVWQYRDSQWQPVYTGTTTDFVHMAASDHLFFMLGKNTLYVAEGNSHELPDTPDHVECPLAVEAATSLFYSGWNESFVTVFAPNGIFEQWWYDADQTTLNSCTGPSGIEGDVLSAGILQGYADIIMSGALSTTQVYQRAEASVFPE